MEFTRYSWGSLRSLFTGIRLFLLSLDLHIMFFLLIQLTEQTRGIIASPLLNKLPQGAALINCGRGAHMINHEVMAALDSGQLGGALIDVFPVEPLPDNDPMWMHPKVIVTPHMASSAQASVIVAQLIDNIARVEQHRPLRNQVDKHHGY